MSMQFLFYILVLFKQVQNPSHESQEIAAKVVEQLQNAMTLYDKEGRLSEVEFPRMGDTTAILSAYTLDSYKRDYTVKTFMNSEKTKIENISTIDIIRRGNLLISQVNF